MGIMSHGDDANRRAAEQRARVLIDHRPQGNAYEELLSNSASAIGSGGGQYFTPRDLILGTTGGLARSAVSAPRSTARPC